MVDTIKDIVLLQHKYMNTEQFETVLVVERPKAR